MVVGRVLRSHAGGYLVYQNDQQVVLQCAARGRLKKERVSIVAGDRVELDEIDTAKGVAVISARLARENILSRPPLANVDQVVIVLAIHQPEWNPLLCDRYLVHFQLELPNTLPGLCFNKCDLATTEEIEALRSIYEPLGYSVMIVSAKAGQGMDQVAKQLDGKVSVLSGPSGVGKSTILNFLEPSLHLRVGEQDRDYVIGRHTTTASELYPIHGHASLDVRTEGESAGWVADTPGFHILELRHPEPHDVVFQFPEILALAHECKFSDCLHLVERGCNVLNNLDQVAPMRYASYSEIVSEAQSEQRSRRDTSHKIEAAVKSIGGKDGNATHVPRLSGRYRAASRRLERQNIRNTTDTEEENSQLEDTERS